ncbi:hypothetical protein JCM19047_4552 [Bacillus sp. JCM 19047]|nr:hypothetical protein JCM19047_4552 [Bacillus sp. JCM 19047]
MSLDRLIVYFIKNAHRELGRTDLNKYVYMFEYHHHQLFGKGWSGIEFNRYYYGPNEESVISTVNTLALEGVVCVESYENYYGGLSYNHSLQQGFNGLEEYDLDSNAELIASFVVEELWNKDYKGVIDFAYSTPPMQEILSEENGGEKQLGRILDMSKSKPVFTSTRRERLLAAKRLKARQSERGSDEEYYQHLVEQEQVLRPFRRRATNAEI